METMARADFVIHKPNGSLVAVVEVKNREEMNPQIATALRRSLITQNVLPDVPYFLLLSQDKAYLWANRRPQERDIGPDFDLSMREIFENYLPSGIVGRLRGDELAIAVHSWLSDLARAFRDPTGATEDALAKIGFIDAIRGAILSREVA